MQSNRGAKALTGSRKVRTSELHQLPRDVPRRVHPSVTRTTKFFAAQRFLSPFISEFSEISLLLALLTSFVQLQCNDTCKSLIYLIKKVSIGYRKQCSAMLGDQQTPNKSLTSTSQRRHLSLEVLWERWRHTGPPKSRPSATRTARNGHPGASLATTASPQATGKHASRAVNARRESTAEPRREQSRYCCG